jgi:hypothetical protein
VRVEVASKQVRASKGSKGKGVSEKEDEARLVGLVVERGGCSDSYPEALSTSYFRPQFQLLAGCCMYVCTFLSQSVSPLGRGVERQASLPAHKRTSRNLSHGGL